MAKPQRKAAWPPMNNPSLPRGSASTPFRARALAFDLDGTLMGGDHVLQPHVEARLRALSRHVPVIFATGRMTPSALPYYRQCGLQTPLVTYNGAKVGLPGEAPWFEATLGSRAVEAVMAFAERYGFYVNLYANDRLYVQHGGRKAESLALLHGVSYEVVDASQARALRPTKIEMLLAHVGDPVQATRALEAVCPPSDIHITPSGPTFLDIMPPGCTKASGLAVVSSRLGIPPGDWVAAGDGGNDREMVAWAGFGVAVDGGDAAVAEGAFLRVPPLWMGGMEALMASVEVGERLP